MECEFSRIAAEVGHDYLSHAVAVYCRIPVQDTRFPQTSDIDLLAFGSVPDVLPERIWVENASIPVDIIWLPQTLLDDPKTLATYGVMAHRMVTSALIYDPDGHGEQAARTVRSMMTQPDISAERIQGILTLGAETTREIGATWDFPALSRFWLQIALSSCIAAACDAQATWCPNVYTRPLDALEQLTAPLRLRLEQSCIELLDLSGVHPATLKAPLQRLHARIYALPLPTWPADYRLDTQWEYRYYRSFRELNWRLAVADEMTAAGAVAQAILLLRFWAYSLARIPMVRQRVAEGIEVAFGRPWVPVYPDLNQHCPDILADLSAILGGNPLPRSQLEQRIEALHDVRDAVVAHCQALGIPLPSQSAWVPAPHRHLLPLTR